MSVPQLYQGRRSGPGLETLPRLLAGCDPDQVEAITTEASPLLVLAGAGSGKTRVLTRRIAWRASTASASAQHVLALTFTRKAAGELKLRLEGLGLPEAVRAGTFHAVALSELKRLAAERRQTPPVVVSSKLRILGALTPKFAPVRSWTGDGRRARTRPGSGKLEEAMFPLVELAQEIEWAKARCLGPADYERSAAIAGRAMSWPPELVSEAFEAYELEKRKRRVLDFEDLLIRLADVLEHDHEFAASARWRTRHVFVDEYQDVNPAQLRLLKLLVDRRDDICVVGDPRQAIYSWNGADPAAIRRFAEDFPGAHEVELRSNYRSTREVLTVAGAVLGQGEPADDVAVAGGGQLPTVTEYATDWDEADGVAAAVRLAKRPGRTWSQIAILVRTNAQLEAFEQALSRRRIPFRATGDPGFLRAEAVQDALREAARCESRETLAVWAADLTTGGGVSPPEEATELTAGLATLARMVVEYMDEDPSPTGRGLRNWVDAMVRSEGGLLTEDAVPLLTFHRAKGLEWPVVFVTGLEEGLVPISYAKDPDSMAEERRLLYVACTRAAEELHCSFARRRQFKGSAKPSERSPSPWLRAIEAAGRDLARARKSDRLTAKEAIDASRRLLSGE